MRVLNSILDEDDKVKKNVDVYSSVFAFVEKFVNKNKLQQREIGSEFSFWLNIQCDDNSPRPAKGYLFCTHIRENLVQHLTNRIISRFEGDIDKIVNSGCTLQLESSI